MLVPAPIEYLRIRGTLAALQAFSSNPDLVVLNVFDYQEVVSGKSPGRPWAEGLKAAEEYRSAHQKRSRKAKSR